MSDPHDFLNGWCDHDDDPNVVVSAACRDQAHDACHALGQGEDCDCGCHDVPEPQS